MNAFAHHPVLRIVTVWLLVASLSGCTSESVWSGARTMRDPDGKSWLELAAPAPHCGCLDLEMNPTYDDDGRGILLQTSFFGQPRGEALLQPGTPLYERFDWAGPLTRDVYHLKAFTIVWNEDGTPKEDMNGDYEIVAELDIESALALPIDPRFRECGTLACQDAALQLDQAVNSQTIWAGAEVNSERNWIELAAPQPECGCLTMVNNDIEQRHIEVRAAFFTDPRGSTKLSPGEQTRVRFDWGGPLAEDRYRLQAFDAATPDGPPIDIRVLGLPHLPPLFMSCDELACEYGDLGLSRAYREQFPDAENTDGR